MQDRTHQSDLGALRPARSAMSGWTLALLLATALASLPASSEAARGGERAARALRTMQAEAYAIAGFELVAFAALAHHQFPAWTNSDSDGGGFFAPMVSAARRDADVAAGLRNLPPPARA